jgi:hypothetical protein
MTKLNVVKHSVFVDQTAKDRNDAVMSDCQSSTQSKNSHIGGLHDQGHRWSSVWLQYMLNLLDRRL